MIWDFIRDFIVQNITGGYDSNLAYYGGFVGYVDGEEMDTGNFITKVGEYNIVIGDWLATTLTTICMCLIFAFAVWLVIWVFKAVAHALLLRR